MKQINDTLKTSINWQTSARLRKRKENTQINNFRNEAGDIVTDSANMKRTKKGRL